MLTVPEDIWDRSVVVSLFIVAIEVTWKFFQKQWKRSKSGSSINWIAPQKKRWIIRREMGNWSRKKNWGKLLRATLIKWSKMEWKYFRRKIKWTEKFFEKFKNHCDWDNQVKIINTAKSRDGWMKGGHTKWWKWRVSVCCYLCNNPIRWKKKENNIQTQLKWKRKL